MKQQRLNRKRHVLDPKDIRDICHEVTPIGEGEMPTKAIGWCDLRGRWKRLEVTYPNGWVLNVGFDDLGKVQNVTFRFSVSFRVGKPKASA